MSYLLDDPRLPAALDAWLNRGPDDCADYEAMARELDAAEARDAALRAPCNGCGLPVGAHSDAALAGCEAVS